MTTRTRTQGYALLEATTALFIGVTGLLGTVHMFQYGVDRVRTIEEYAIAGRLLQNELETLRAESFDSLEPAHSRPFVSRPPELKLLHRAETSVRVTAHASLPARLREVTVTIRWRTEYGRHVERRLTTLIARSDAA